MFGGNISTGCHVSASRKRFHFDRDGRHLRDNLFLVENSNSRFLSLSDNLFVGGNSNHRFLSDNLFLDGNTSRFLSFNNCS